MAMRSRRRWIGIALQFCLALGTGCVAADGKTAVILSTDVGNEIDDQWAITYMMVHPNFDVRAIISAQGPSLPDPSAHWTYKVLLDVVEHRLGMSVHPPLFEGSSVPLANLTTALPNAGVDFVIRTSKEFSRENRLTVLTIGAATDVASAILTDPSIADRIRVVAMGFNNLQAGGGKEYNVQNDPKAWQVILQSNVPVVIGTGEVCRKYLSLNLQQARDLVSRNGSVGEWLWDDFQVWYFRNVKPLRVSDYTKSWIIWDIITLAYLNGMGNTSEVPRPLLTDELSFGAQQSGKTIQVVTEVDSKQLWADFTKYLQEYQASHKTPAVSCVR